MSIGGDAEQYMDAPTLPTKGGGGDDGGNGSFFANMLDLLGIHRQVAKGPKEDKTASPVKSAASPNAPGKSLQGQSANLSTPSLPILDSVAKTFPPSHMIDTPIGIDKQQWLGGYRSTAGSSMQMIDPDLGF